MTDRKVTSPYTLSAILMRQINAGRVPSKEEIEAVIASDQPICVSFARWLEDYHAGKVRRPRGRPLKKVNLDRLIWELNLPWIIPSMAKEKRKNHEQYRETLREKTGYSLVQLLELQYPERAEKRAVEQMLKSKKAK